MQRYHYYPGMFVEILLASANKLVLRGVDRSTPEYATWWMGEYVRVPGTLAFLLVSGTNCETDDTASALPHGEACVIPALLGRAVLVSALKYAYDRKIMAHERGHVIAYRAGLELPCKDDANRRTHYQENENLADKLADQLLGVI